MLVVFFLKAASTQKWNDGVQNRRITLTRLFIAHILGVASYMYGFFVHNILEEERKKERQKKKKEKKKGKKEERKKKKKMKERKRERKKEKRKKERKRRRKKARKREEERKKIPLFCGQNAQVPKRPPVFVPLLNKQPELGGK